MSQETICFADGVRRWGAGDKSAFEGFFAISMEKPGFCGVAILARRGLVLRASKVLNDWEASGRYIEVELSACILVNVYAPNDGGNQGRGLDEHMRFLLALERRVCELQKIKPVCLVGDLNLKARWKDVEWKHRSLNLNRLMSSPVLENEPALVATLRILLKEKLELLVKEVKEGVTVKPVSETRFHFHLKDIRISMVATEYDSLSWTDLSCPRVVEASELLPPEVLPPPPAESMTPDKRFWICYESASIKLEYLSGILQAVFGMEPQSLEAMRRFADFNEHGALSAGRVCTTAWLASMIERGLFIDTFAVAHGRAVERYTCWDNYTQARGSNIGSRLDYVLLDPRLKFKRSLTLAGCACPPGACFPGCSDDFESAHRAANAYQRDGDTMYRGLGSGIIYTPLDMSDHCAVDIIIDAQFDMVALGNDARTKACQPHRALQTISTLFQRQPQPAPVVAAAASPRVVAPPVRSISEPTPKSKGTLLDSFVIRSTEPVPLPGSAARTSIKEKKEDVDVGSVNNEEEEEKKKKSDAVKKVGAMDKYLRRKEENVKKKK